MMLHQLQKKYTQRTYISGIDGSHSVNHQFGQSLTVWGSGEIGALIHEVGACYDLSVSPCVIPYRKLRALYTLLDRDSDGSVSFTELALALQGWQAGGACSSRGKVCKLYGCRALNMGW